MEILRFIGIAVLSGIVFLVFLGLFRPILKGSVRRLAPRVARRLESISIGHFLRVIFIGFLLGITIPFRGTHWYHGNPVGYHIAAIGYGIVISWFVARYKSLQDLLALLFNVGRRLYRRLQDWAEKALDTQDYRKK